VGNGGNAVVCEKSVELLDYFESANLKRFKISPPKGGSFKEIAQKTLDRIRKYNPQLHRQYSRVLEKISDRIKFIDKSDFRDIKDSFEVAVPHGCKIEQVANQQDVDGVRLFYISKSLWDKMPLDNQAGLILHEIIYEHFLFLGEPNSVKARQFNAYLGSAEIQTQDEKEYLKFVRNLKLPLY